MLGYLAGFQLDTSIICFKRFDFSAIIPDNIEKENWANNNFLVYCFFLKTRHFSRDTARSTRTYSALGR
jgi:hypothetical protein